MLSKLRNRRLATLASIATLAVAAGCGGASKNGAGAAGKDGEAAKAFPATTVAFVDADTDTTSAAWTKMLTVLRRFPSFPKLEAKLQSELAKPGATSGASFAKDVEPWLGSEAAVGVVGVQVAAQPKPQVLGYAASKDDAKAKAFVTDVAKATANGSYKGYSEYTRSDAKDPMFVAVGKGVVLVASDAATLKQGIDTREGGDALADASDYKATLDKLSGDNAAVAYVNGKELGQLIQLAASSGAAGSAGASLGALGGSQAQLANLRGIGVSLSADQNGFRIRSVALGANGSTKVSDVSSALRGAVPGDAFVYGAAGASDALSKALTGSGSGSAAQQQQMLQAIAAQTGIDLQTDLPALFDGGLAFYAAPGTPLRGGLVLHPSDATKAATVMHKITAAIAKFSPTVKFTPIAGGTGEEATVNGLHVAWQKTGDNFTVTIDKGGAGSASGGLDANDTYKRLIGEVGGTSGAAGELFVDVQKIVDAATAAGATLSPEARTNLSHVGGIAAVTKTDGDAQSVDALVEVR